MKELVVHLQPRVHLVFQGFFSRGWNPRSEAFGYMPRTEQQESNERPCVNRNQLYLFMVADVSTHPVRMTSYRGSTATKCRERREEKKMSRIRAVNEGEEEKREAL